MGNAHALPFHPTTGLQALEIGRRGPIWPVMGGSEDDGADGAGGDDGTKQDQNQNGGAGNDAGKGKPKRDALYADLPDDHPLVKAYERVKADNKVLKPKAQLVDDAENAKKTDAQKIADLQGKVDALPAEVALALREHLVELHSIEQDDADLFLTGATPELMLKQVKGLLEKSGGTGPKRGNHVRREGTPQQRSQGSDETRDFVRTLTNREQ